MSGETGGRLIEQACEIMHGAYEGAAVDAGWETQARSRVPWADVPDANKVTMRAAVSALLDFLAARAGANAVAVADAWDEGLRVGVALVERGYASPNPYRATLRPDPNRGSADAAQ